MTKKEEIRLNLKLSTIVSGEMFKDYCTLLKIEYGGLGGQNDKHLSNLCGKIEKSVTTLLKNVSREIINPENKDIIEKEVNRNFELVYDIANLSLRNQQRISNLILKLKKEEQL